MADIEIHLIIADDLVTQPWWPSLLDMINTAFMPKRPTTSRLDSDAHEAADQLEQELGPGGFLIVAFDKEQPVACVGLSTDRISSRAPDLSTEDVNALRAIFNAPAVSATPRMNGWVLCCAATAASHRRQGLCSRLVERAEAELGQRDAERVLIYFPKADTGLGSFWRARGFEVMKEAHRTTCAVKKFRPGAQ